MNPYYKFVSSIESLLREAKALPPVEMPEQRRAEASPTAPLALIFSPHPDDECLIGGLALRLLREAGIRVLNVAVTHGSNKERQQPRLEELKRACGSLGFGLEQTAPNGLEQINVKSRAADAARWAESVKIIASCLGKNQPRAVFVPHELDWNGTHIGTHFLVMDALATLPSTFGCFLVETEFWGQMASPNLMVESSTQDVADLMAALSCHVGEVKRNPFHLRMPAWMQDNVRRGAESVGGQGSTAPDFTFATLYRVRQWKNGRLEDVYAGGKLIGKNDSCAGLFR